MSPNLLRLGKIATFILGRLGISHSSNGGSLGGDIFQAELSAILDDPSFRRSQTLGKLLTFLVQETIAGRGETLKSYSLAVEGLGKPDDYDPSSDSSARVQMIRLRKTLESYYAKNSPTGKLCLYLRPGSYLVRLDEPAIAYPTLHRSNYTSEDSVGSDRLEVVPKRPVSASSNPTRGSKPFPRLPLDAKTKQLIASVFIVGLATLAAERLFFSFVPPMADAPRLTPIMVIMPVQTDGDVDLEPLSDHLQSVYATDLPRFKFAKVRLHEGRSRSVSAPNEKGKYRLNSRLVSAAGDNAKLISTVEDTEQNTIVWTDSVVMPLDPDKAHSQIVPILGQVSGPTGAIALHQALLSGNTNDGGYPCMLKYFEFIRTRAAHLENQLITCFSKPIAEQDIAATMFGIQAMFELERPSARKNFATANARGIALARRGISIDPNDAWANFAMARLAYAAKDCRSALVYSDRTMEANPNSPLFPAVLASLSPVCKDPHAEKLLDQALLTQSPLYIRSRLLLAQAAIYQGTPEKIALIKDSEVPETNLQKRYYYATETLIAASQGRDAEANRNWKAFEAVSDPTARSADEKLAAIIVIPAMRKLFATYLRNAGVDL